MNNTIIKIKLFALSFLIASSITAQQKLTKVSQSIKVDKDVTIDLNISHCNIVLDTWNKGSVEIEAYVEGEGLSDEELQEALKKWEVDVDASQNEVAITTARSAPKVWTYNSNNEDNLVSVILEELKFELADLPEVIVGGLGVGVEVPEMPELPELPELPKGVKSFHFDYDAYKKDGEKYLEKYTQKFESTYGDDYAKKMEAWGEKFGEEWGETFGKRMEAWAKEFEKNFESEAFEDKMEAWGERFGAQIEQQVERMTAQKEHANEQKNIRKEHAKEREKYAEKREKLTNKRKVLIEELAHEKANSKVKKTIKIKMPKDAKLKVNVRHGEIEFAANVDNLKADLAYTKFKAHSINGSSTSINASYSDLVVDTWNQGTLDLHYVKDALLKNVNGLILNANSSDINVDNLSGNSIINGSFGELVINNLQDSFSNLNVVLVNSDAFVKLPKTDYQLIFIGNRSKFNGEIISNKTLNKGDLNTAKTIMVNAKFSDVIME